MNDYSAKPKSKPVVDNEDEILEAFRKDFKAWHEAEEENIRLWKEDKKFTWEDEEQWDEADRNSRKNDGRPCITVNKVQTFVRQVVNDALQNKMSIRVRPVDDQTDLKTAKVIQGMARHIEKISKAHLAYQTAFEDAVAAGFGYFRITTQYRDEESFAQDIRIVPINNALSAFLDPMRQTKDGSDAKFGGVFERMWKTEFKRLHPGFDGVQDIDGIQHQDEGFWGDSEKVLLAEYFRCEYTPETLLLLDDGQGGTQSMFESEAKRQGIDIKSEDPFYFPKVINHRKSYRKKVMWYKIGGKKILKAQEWPSKFIPIIPVVGRETCIEGKRRYMGLTRYAKGSQKYYNLARSAQLERIALAPRAPWIGAEGQFEGHEAKWKLANVRRFPYLEYKPITLNGQFAPPPQRMDPVPVDGALTQETMTASDEIKATTGIFDASLGAQGNETSGKAIMARQREGDTATFDFNHNLITAIAHGAEIIADLIPVIYDVPEAVRILGENEKEEIVRINDPGFVDPRTGKPTLYNLKAGKYDIDVDAGPSYATKRQEAAESIMAFVQTPGGQPFGQISGDILAGALDWEGSEELSERYRKFLAMQHPGLIEEKNEDGSPKQQMDPQAQAEIERMKGEMDQMRQEMEDLQRKAEGKEIESDTKIRIAEMDNATKVAIAKMGPEGSENMAVLAQEILYLRSLLEQPGPSAPAPAPGPMPGEPIPQQGPMDSAMMPPEQDPNMGQPYAN